MGKSPFEVVLDRQPLTPLDVVQRNQDGSCSVVHRVARERTEILQEAWDSLEIAIRRMDQSRRDHEFEPSEHVLLKIIP